MRSFLVIIFLLIAAPATAVTIKGGSNLLDSASADKLEAWLGEGPISLWNIYTKQAGDTANDFHNAADGRG